MKAPLEFDLAAQVVGAVEHKTVAHAASHGLRNFRQLLDCPAPPLRLLVMAKDFFKSQSGHGPKRRPEQEVSYLMYLASILAAKVRLGQSISKLGLNDLSRGIQWAISQAWVDPRTRSFFLDAQDRIAVTKA